MLLFYDINNNRQGDIFIGVFDTGYVTALWATAWGVRQECHEKHPGIKN